MGMESAIHEPDGENSWFLSFKRKD